MYNVIIMDQNRNNRQKIKHYIDDVKDDYKVIAEISTPGQADRLLRNHDIDLIIGDDVTASQTGLQFFNSMTGEYPELHMILLTERNQYSHSKETFNQGKIDYLYKPVRKNDVVNSLKHMRKRLEYAHAKTKADSALRDYYESNIEQFRERFLMNLIYGSIRQSDYIYNQLDYFHIAYADGFAIAIYKIDDYKKYQLALEEDEQQFLIFSVYDIIRQSMTKDGVGIPFISRYDEVTLLFTSVTSQMDLLELNTNYHKVISDQLDIMGTLGIGRLYPSPDQVHLSYNQAVDAVLEHDYLGKNTVIHIDYVSGKNDLAYAYAPELETMLIKYTMSGQLDNALKTLKKIWDGLANADDYDSALYLAFVKKLTTHLYRDGLVYHYHLETIINSQLGAIDEDKIYDHETTYDTMKNVLQIASHYIQEHKSDQDRLLLENVLKYVQAYHTSRISLASAAQYLETTPKHLEDILYKIYEQSFFDFCMSVRIENAKDMLIRTRMSIGDIARNVGFNNAEYFVAIFKQNEHMTPVQYRHQDKNTSTLPLTLANGQRSPMYGRKSSYDKG